MDEEMVGLSDAEIAAEHAGKQGQDIKVDRHSPLLLQIVTHCTEIGESANCQIDRFLIC